MSTTYINLPRLEKISVQDYSLFLKNWTYSLTDGLNLFVGANGLWKTTTTYLIIYGIIGEYEDEININYFKQRRYEAEDDKNGASVIVDFNIGKNSISVERYLFQNKIKKITINRTSFDESTTEEIERYYNDKLMEMIGIKNIGDIVFLLKKFMIREEEGNYLLWDSLDQSKLIRLIINAAGFEEQYNKVATDVKNYDTELRGNQDIKAQFVKRQNELKIKKEEILLKKPEYKSQKELEFKINSIEEDINDLKLKRMRCSENINYYTANLNSCENQIEQISSNFESISENLIAIERKFYTTIYSDNKVLASIHKLKTYNICIYCNTQLNNNISEKIIQSVEISHHCPVCKSRLKEVKPTQKPTEELSNELNKLRDESDNYQLRLNDLRNEKETTLKNLTESYNELHEFDNKISQQSIIQFGLKQKLNDLNANPEELITEFDMEILALQKQINQYDNIIESSRKNFERGKNKLIKKNNELNETIDSFTSKLNNIFKKYATSYFNANCVLTTYEQPVKQSKVPLTTYIPEFENKRRLKARDCSTSERIFLEYLFRLSLVELYNKITKNNSILILETSEGAFDLSNTRQLSNAFISYSKNNLPFIIIVNFSKPKFIEDLLSHYNNPAERVLNFLDFGRLTKQQKENIKEFNRVLKDLKLPVI